jgi:AraC-like DNA-binding protein
MPEFRPDILEGTMPEVVVPAQELFALYRSAQEGKTGPIDVRKAIGIEPPYGYEGRFDLWSPGPGYLVAFLDISVINDFTTITPLENYFTLEVILKGNSEIHLGGSSMSNDGLPRIYLASHGPNSSKRRVHKEGDSVRSVGIWIEPTVFLESFGVEIDQLRDDIRMVLTNPDSGVTTLPVTTQVKHTANEIFDTGFEGRRGEQYLKAKLTELLCHVAELANTQAAQLPEDLPLPRGKANALKKFMLALEQSHYLSLSLGEIAGELGLCANTLSNVFKEGYGMKLSEYLLQRRMEQAQELLRSGKQSVLEVALEVGYENQSSFGRAYRQFHGNTPREDLPAA